MIIRKYSVALLLFWLGLAVSPICAEEAPAGPSAPSSLGRPLRQILIADSVATAEKIAPVPGGPFVIVAPTLPSINVAELNKRLATGENRVIDERLLAAIAQVIENFFRQSDYAVATAVVPGQKISDGVVRIIVFIGKIRNITVKGTHWFSESLLREKLRVEQGSALKFSELDRAISWTNNNPFRRVQVKVDAVPATGEADLTIAVQEAFPLRLTASYDNNGNVILGRDRYTAAVSYANLWGRDHQVSYQYLTTELPRFFQGHGLDYRIPLPWRHYLQVSASYVRARPEILGGLFKQDGKTATADLRYSIPLRTGENPMELSAAINFKQTNNNLAYGGSQVDATQTDIFQFTGGFSSLRRDKRGAWAFSLNVVASPGGINSRNTDTAFDAARFGAKAAYLYGNASVQRLLSLGYRWDLVSRAVLQVSQANLLPSEALSIGGSATVRGYNENIFNGDNGFVFANDLMAPSWKISVPKISRTRGPLEVRLLGFFDAADASVRHPYTTDARRVPIASTGFGLRASLSNNFSASVDYGWQLSTLPYENNEHSRGHIKVTLAY